jgi:hypothetical protein
MHNCRETKEQLTELVLDGADRQADEALLAELRRCVECRGEFDALKATLRIVNRFSETAAPTEGYWIRYHARLRQKLSIAVNNKTHDSHGPSWLVRAFKSSIHVPVPVAVAVIVVCVALLQFALRGTRQQVIRPLNTTVVEVPVEVPVVHEKIVTRVVYREQRSRRSQQTVGPAKVDTTFAKSQKPQNEDIPVSLVGFKPTDEIKLTVIKGGSSNEK